MSALGERIALLSLGLACQTARQIDAHISRLRQLTGDESLDKVSMPFDWLVSTARGLAGMLAEGCFFPESPTELYYDQGRLRLRRHDVMYWHVGRLTMQAGDPGFEDNKAKFRHTSGRFKEIAGVDRVVAVLADTQYNMPEIEDKWGMRLTDTSVEEADEARWALAGFLGRPVDLLMVSRNPRPDFPQRPDFAFYHMVPLEGAWGGSATDWTQVFEDYFSRA